MFSRVALQVDLVPNPELFRGLKSRFRLVGIVYTPLSSNHDCDTHPDDVNAMKVKVVLPSVLRVDVKGDFGRDNSGAGDKNLVTLRT